MTRIVDFNRKFVEGRSIYPINRYCVLRAIYGILIDKSSAALSKTRNKHNNMAMLNMKYSRSVTAGTSSGRGGRKRLDKRKGKYNMVKQKKYGKDLLETIGQKYGVSAEYQNDWVEPVLVQVSRCGIEESEFCYIPDTPKVGVKNFQTQLIRFLIQGRVDAPLEFDISEIEKGLASSGLSTGNIEFVEDCIAQYKKDKKADFWSDRNFKKLSAKITDILGVRSRVENCVLSAADDSELTDMLFKTVHQSFPGAQAKEALALSQCLMKDMSMNEEENEMRKKIYFHWMDSMREGGSTVL